VHDRSKIELNEKTIHQFDPNTTEREGVKGMQKEYSKPEVTTLGEVTEKTTSPSGSFTEEWN
jgi:hypothetical protein